MIHNAGEHLSTYLYGSIGITEAWNNSAGQDDDARGLEVTEDDVG